jgi:hypothetical protein
MSSTSIIFPFLSAKRMCSACVNWCELSQDDVQLQGNMVINLLVLLRQ